MKSNIKLRSNVHLYNSQAFKREVRGRAALLKLLRSELPQLSEMEAARQLDLKPRQRAQLAWDIPCSECGAVPEGPVRAGGEVLLTFRCPRTRCALNSGRGAAQTGKFVNLSLELVNMGLRRFGGDASTLLQRALNVAQLRGVDQNWEARDARQFTVRLTRTHDYTFHHESFREFSARANAALKQFLKSENNV